MVKQYLDVIFIRVLLTNTLRTRLNNQNIEKCYVWCGRLELSLDGVDD